MKEAGINYGIPLRKWRVPTAGEESARGLHGYGPGRPPQGGGFELRPEGCIEESSGRRWRKERTRRGSSICKGPGVGQMWKGRARVIRQKQEQISRHP